MVTVEFMRAAHGRRPDTDTSLLALDMPQPPGVGEAVTVRGAKWLVLGRHWLCDGPPRCMVRLVPLEGV